MTRMVKEHLRLDSPLPERVGRPFGVIEGGRQDHAGRISSAPKGHGTRIEGHDLGTGLQRKRFVTEDRPPQFVVRGLDGRHRLRVVDDDVRVLGPDPGVDLQVPLGPVGLPGGIFGVASVDVNDLGPGSGHLRRGPGLFSRGDGHARILCLLMAAGGGAGDDQGGHAGGQSPPVLDRVQIVPSQVGIDGTSGRFGFQRGSRIQGTDQSIPSFPASAAGLRVNHRPGNGSRTQSWPLVLPMGVTEPVSPMALHSPILDSLPGALYFRLRSTDPRVPVG